MSQMKIDSTIVSQVNFQQDQPNAGAVKQGQKSAISDVVKDVEVRQPQTRQVRRSAAYIAGRVALGVLTVGISEIGFAIANKVGASARQKALEQPAEKSAPAQQKVGSNSMAQNNAESLKAEDKAFNEELQTKLKVSLQALKEPYQEAVQRAFDEMRQNGEIPHWENKNCKNFNGLVDDKSFRERISQNVAKSTERVTPETFVALVKDAARKEHDSQKVWEENNRESYIQFENKLKGTYQREKDTTAFSEKAYDQAFLGVKQEMSEKMSSMQSFKDMPGLLTFKGMVRAAMQKETSPVTAERFKEILMEQGKARLAADAREKLLKTLTANIDGKDLPKDYSAALKKAFAGLTAPLDGYKMPHSIKDLPNFNTFKSALTKALNAQPEITPEIFQKAVEDAADKVLMEDAGKKFAPQLYDAIKNGTMPKQFRAAMQEALADMAPVKGYGDVPKNLDDVPNKAKFLEALSARLQNNKVKTPDTSFKRHFKEVLEAHLKASMPNFSSSVLKKEALPEAYETAIGQGLRELKQEMGKYVPGTMHDLDSVLIDKDSPELFRELFSEALETRKNDMTPELFKEILKDTARQIFAESAFSRLAKRIGLPQDVYRIVPELMQDIKGAKTADELDAAMKKVENKKTEIVAFANQYRTAFEKAKSELSRKILEAGSQLGLKAEDILAKTFVDDLRKIAGTLTLDQAGKISAAFEQGIAAFMDNITSLFSKIDANLYSDELKAEWKRNALTSRTFRENFELYAQGSRPKDLITELRTTKDKTKIREQLNLLVQNAIERVAKGVEEKASANGYWRDDREAGICCLQYALQQSEELRHLTSQNYDLMKEIAAECKASGDPQITYLAECLEKTLNINTAIVDNIKNNEALPKEGMDILRQAVKDTAKELGEYPGLDPEKLASGAEIKDMLKALLKSKSSVTLEDFNELCKLAARHDINTKAARSIAESKGLSEEFAFKNPIPAAKLDAAGSYAEVEDLVFKWSVDLQLEKPLPQIVADLDASYPGLGLKDKLDIKAFTSCGLWNEFSAELKKAGYALGHDASEQDILAAFSKPIEAFKQNLGKIFDQFNQLSFPSDIKADWMNKYFSSDTFRNNFDSILSAASPLSVPDDLQCTALTHALNSAYSAPEGVDGNVDSLRNELKGFLENATKDVQGAEAKEEVAKYALQYALAANKELGLLFANKADVLQQIIDEAKQEGSAVGSLLVAGLEHVQNFSVLIEAHLNDPDRLPLPSALQSVMEDVRRDFTAKLYYNNTPKNLLTIRFESYKKIGDKVMELIQNNDPRVRTVEGFKELLISTIRDGRFQKTHW